MVEKRIASLTDEVGSWIHVRQHCPVRAWNSVHRKGLSARDRLSVTAPPDVRWARAFKRAVYFSVHSVSSDVVEK